MQIGDKLWMHEMHPLLAALGLPERQGTQMPCAEMPLMCKCAPTEAWQESKA